MSQMPDNIWLHKDTKYNTGDIVCGYQYEFAEGIEDEGGIENFVEYIRKDAFIEKAEEFIYSALNDGIMGTANIEDFMRLFKKYMER